MHSPNRRNQHGSVLTDRFLGEISSPPGPRPPVSAMGSLQTELSTCRRSLRVRFMLIKELHYSFPRSFIYLFILKKNHRKELLPNTGSLHGPALLWAVAQVQQKRWIERGEGRGGKMQCVDI